MSLSFLTHVEGVTNLRIETFIHWLPPLGCQILPGTDSFSNTVFYETTFGLSLSSGLSSQHLQWVFSAWCIRGPDLFRMQWKPETRHVPSYKDNT